MERLVPVYEVNPRIYWHTFPQIFLIVPDKFFSLPVVFSITGLSWKEIFAFLLMVTMDFFQIVLTLGVRMAQIVEACWVVGNRRGVGCSRGAGYRGEVGHRRGVGSSRGAVRQVYLHQTLFFGFVAGMDAASVLDAGLYTGR